MSATGQPGTGRSPRRHVSAGEQVFEAFTAWERQGEWIPLTKVRVVSGDGGEGSLIEAVTAVGPAVLRDEMRVDKLDPPYEVRVVHCGTAAARARACMRCTPLASGRTQVVWHEWFHLPGGAAGRVAWPVLWPGSKLSLHARRCSASPGWSRPAAAMSPVVPCS